MAVRRFTVQITEEGEWTERKWASAPIVVDVGVWPEPVSDAIIEAIKRVMRNSLLQGIAGKVCIEILPEKENS